LTTNEVNGSEQAIVKRKKAEEALRLSEEKYRLIVETAEEGIWLAKPDGTTIYVNQKMADMLGYSPEEIVGKIGIEFLARGQEPLVLQTRKKLDRSARLQREFQLLRKDGTTLWTIANTAPIFEHGQHIANIAMHTDITERKKAETMLRRQAALLDLSPDAILVRAIDGTITFWSKGAEKLYGFSAIEAHGKNSHKLLKTQFFTPVDKINQQVESSGSWQGELIHKTKAGQEVIVQSRWSFEKTGKKPSIYESNIDITARKKAEEALKISEQRYHQLFTSMTEMFQVIELIFGKDGKAIDYYYREVNPAFEKLVGKSREQLIDKRVKDIFGIIEDCWLQEYSEAVKTGNPCHFENYGAELDKWYDVYVWKANDKQVAITFTDISERKKAEAKTQKLQEVVQQERDRLASLVNSMNDEVWFADTEKKFTLANPAAIREFKIGSSGEVVDAENLAATEEIYRSDGSPRPVEESPALRGLRGETLKNEIEIVRTPASGELRYRQVNAAPVRSTEGKIIGSVSVARDITDLKQLQNRLQNYNADLQKLVEERTKQLKDSERLAAIGATAGMVGHDIRNPLQAITSDVYLAKTELALTSESDEKKNALESLSEIEKNIDYINKIVQDLQDYSRPLNPSAKGTDLEALCREIFLKSNIPKNIKTSFRSENEAKQVMADPDLLKRIISNLVLNAVQAMPKGGNLSIYAYRKEGGLIIEVQDTGEGIPEEVKTKLFTPMFTTKSKGQGFGLAVVKRVTEAMNGTVSFDSERGKGTKFIVRLPPQGAKR
jgi:PAS domain S-box-containing protein